MLRFRENPKAPDINALTRHYLWRGLSKLPDVTKHVANPSDLEKMGMWELLKLAKTLGIDADDVIRAPNRKSANCLTTLRSFPASGARSSSIGRWRFSASL